MTLVWTIFLEFNFHNNIKNIMRGMKSIERLQTFDIAYLQ